MSKWRKPDNYNSMVFAEVMVILKKNPTMDGQVAYAMALNRVDEDLALLNPQQKLEFQEAK